MAKQFDALNADRQDFILRQNIFFTASATASSRVNVSPREIGALRIMGDNTVIYLDRTGSGNETAAHLLEIPRMTIMFCSFDKQPLILRLYGKATAIHPRDNRWNELSGDFPDYTGARQIFELDIEMVQTSCGYAVPFYDLKGERKTLDKWAENKGREGVENYWLEKNTTSLDGKDTGILQDS